MTWPPSLADARPRPRPASATVPCCGFRRLRPRKCHEFETDLGEIAVRQPRIRRSRKINMSRAVRPYTAACSVSVSWLRSPGALQGCGPNVLTGTSSRPADLAELTDLGGGDGAVRAGADYDDLAEPARRLGTRTRSRRRGHGPGGMSCPAAGPPSCRDGISAANSGLSCEILSFPPSPGSGWLRVRTAVP